MLLLLDKTISTFLDLKIESFNTIAWINQLIKLIYGCQYSNRIQFSSYFLRLNEVTHLCGSSEF